jgi:hypothetical protein
MLAQAPRLRGVPREGGKCRLPSCSLRRRKPTPAKLSGRRPAETFVFLAIQVVDLPEQLLVRRLVGSPITGHLLPSQEQLEIAVPELGELAPSWFFITAGALCVAIALLA